MKEDTIKTDIVILGHIAKDIIEIDGKSRFATGGAVYYGGIAGSQCGLKVLVITRLSKEDENILLDFKKHGVLYRISYSDETTGIRNIYDSKNLEVRTCIPLDFAGLFQKGDIPEVETEYFILAPLIAGEIDIDLLDYLAEKYPDKLCMDIQGFVRVRDKVNNLIYFCNLEEQEKVNIISKINVLKLDHAEAKALTQKDDIKEAANDLLSIGPKEILISHSKGISVFLDNCDFFFPWKYKAINGRTGRGDTAFIGYVGSRITKNPEDSLKFAAALTSLKLEHPGPFVLPLHAVHDLIKKEY